MSDEHGRTNHQEQSGLEAYDFEVPYLRHILSFIGITDITFIQAGGTMQVAQQHVSADEFMAPLLQQITDAV